MKTEKTMAEKFLAKGWKLASQALPKYGDTIIVARFLNGYKGNYYFVSYDIEDVSHYNTRIAGSDDKVECFTDSSIIFWKTIHVPSSMFSHMDSSIRNLIEKGGEL